MLSKVELIRLKHLRATRKCERHIVSLIRFLVRIVDSFDIAGSTWGLAIVAFNPQQPFDRHHVTMRKQVECMQLEY